MTTNTSKPSSSGEGLGLKAAITLIITTVGLTYAVLSTLLIAPLKEERDDLRKERDKLEEKQAIYQKLQEDPPPVDSSGKPDEGPVLNRKMLQTAIELIQLGQKIKQMPPAEPQSEVAFGDWRDRSVAFLSGLDQRTGSGFATQFKVLTEFEPANYQTMPQCAADGLLVLQAAKGRILNPKR